VEGVSNLAQLIATRFLFMIIGPANRMRAIATALLNSWQQGDTQALASDFASLTPVLASADASAVFGQDILDFSSPSSLANGFAIVDMNPTRVMDFMSGRFSQGGNMSLNIPCLARLVLAGGVDYDTASPAPLACLRPVNHTAMCAKYPRRCDAFQQALDPNVATAALAWRFSRPLHSLLTMLAQEFPFIEPSYLDDTGTFAVYSTPSLPIICQQQSGLPLSSCSYFTLASYFGSDQLTSAVLAQPFAFQQREQSGTLTDANYFQPQIFNARRPDMAHILLSQLR
jgi:hypothetical protein